MILRALTYIRELTLSSCQYPPHNITVPWRTLQLIHELFHLFVIFSTLISTSQPIETSCSLKTGAKYLPHVLIDLRVLFCVAAT